MKVPEGVSFHGWGYVLKAGDEIPEELLTRLPDDHPLKLSKSKPAREKPQER